MSNVRQLKVLSTAMVLIGLAGLLPAMLLPRRAFAIASVAALLATIYYFASRTGIEAKAYGLFMGLPFVGITYGAGSAVGLVLRAFTGGHARWRVVLAMAGVILGALFTVVQVRDQRAEAEWIAEATRASQELVSHDPEVLRTVRRIDRALLMSTTIPSQGSLPLTALEFSVSGPASSARVQVKIAGNREQPRYSVSSVKAY